ncbi:conserved hypothetical protein, partial [Trichinella spiralis]|uniref:hypothetical protein n=1 Tax=Trichinella spiralis TaxID=6334 RepID=UPI0001EFD470
DVAKLRRKAVRPNLVTRFIGAIATEAVYKAHCQQEISTLTQAQRFSEKVMNKPVVAARPGKDFPWCAVPNLGSTRSQRHETIAGSGRSGLSNGTTWNSGGETCDICASRGSHLKKLRSPMKI